MPVASETEDDVIDISTHVAAVCHAYGYLPQEVLSMAYRHFLLLATSIDKLERRRAMYMAVAFHDPKKLQQTEQDEETRTIKATKENMNEVLKLVNGR